MSDWDLLFLQAAGKSGSSGAKINAETNAQKDVLKEDNVAADTVILDDSISRSKRKRKSTSTVAKGCASKCLSQCGFRFSKNISIRCKTPIGARYLLKDTWDETAKSLTLVQSTIRDMFMIVRNTRSLAFRPCCRGSIDPICNAYIGTKDLVLSSLVALLHYARVCPGVQMTRTHIQTAITSLNSLPQEKIYNDCKTSDVSEETSSTFTQLLNEFNSKSHEETVRFARVACLILISSLDGIYGELLVAAVDAGVILPDPRLYLESLCGQTDNCFSSSSSSSDTYVSNPLFRYLELRTIEASLLNIPLLCSAAVAFEGLSAGDDEGTMRGKDPLCSNVVRAWRRTSRFRVAAWAAFACPNMHAITSLKDFSQGLGLVEVGAGVGYWASMLRNAGVDVNAYDKQPASTFFNKKASNYVGNSKKMPTNEYHGRFDAWTVVAYGDATTSSNSKRVLFLCYPPPKDPMALKALRCYTGDRIAHVGEMRGDTGTKEFEAELSMRWVRHCDPIALPNFGDTCYALTLWTRRGKEGSTNSTPPPPPQYLRLMTCPGCGAVPPTQDSKAPVSWYRDRLTRCVWACSLSCARSEEARSVLKLEMQQRYIDYGISDSPEDDDRMWKSVAL
jgi:hypothetical protein